MMSNTCGGGRAASQARPHRLAVLLIGAAALSGCATTYQPHGLTGGFEESQVNATSFRVAFRGNGYTSVNRAQELTLLRSAELCLERGYPGFVLLRENTNVKTDSIWMSNSSWRRGNLFSTGTNFDVSTPSTSNLVSCIREKPANVFSYDAVVLYESLTTKYQVPRSPRFSDWKTNVGAVSPSLVLESPQPVEQPTQAPAQARAVDRAIKGEWLASASQYAQQVGCSADPSKGSRGAQGVEQYEFLCGTAATLKLECRTVAGGCRIVR